MSILAIVKKQFFLLIAVLSLILVSGCGKEESAPQQKPASLQNEPVRIGLAMQPSSALALIARDKGYFRKHGLNPEFYEFPSGKRALLEGLFVGKVDVATSSDIPVAMAALRDKKFKILATTFNADNVNRIIGRKDAGILSPDNLAGKRLATQRSSAVHYFLHLFLLENAIDEDKESISYMKAEQLPQALHDGSIDAFSMREPYISQARDMLGDNAIVFAAPGIYSQVDILVSSHELVEKQPQVARALLAALLDAEHFVVTQPREAMKMIATDLGTTEGEINKIWPTLKFSLRLDQSLLLLLESESRWAIRHGYTMSKSVPDFMEYIEVASLKELAPNTVTLIH